MVQILAKNFYLCLLAVFSLTLRNNFFHTGCKRFFSALLLGTFLCEENILCLAIMIQKKKNIGRFNARQLFTVVFTVFLLFSSCSTKRGIKTLLDIPVSTTKTVHHTENNKLGSLTSNCLSCEDLQVLTVDSIDISSLKNLSAAILITNVFWSFSLDSLQEEVTEYAYSPPNSLGDVPIYLLFKKLILYNA